MLSSILCFQPPNAGELPLYGRRGPRSFERKKIPVRLSHLEADQKQAIGVGQNGMDFANQTFPRGVKLSAGNRRAFTLVR